MKADTPNGYEQLSSWDDLARRLRQVTGGCQGAAVVTVEVFTARGKPVAWKPPEVTPLEPKGRADAFAEWVSAACSA